MPCEASIDMVFISRNAFFYHRPPAEKINTTWLMLSAGLLCQCILRLTQINASMANSNAKSEIHHPYAAKRCFPSDCPLSRSLRNRSKKRFVINWGIDCLQ